MDATLPIPAGTVRLMLVTDPARVIHDVGVFTDGADADHARATLDRGLVAEFRDYPLRFPYSVVDAGARALHADRCSGDCGLVPGRTGQPVTGCAGEPSDDEYEAARLVLRCAGTVDGGADLMAAPTTAEPDTDLLGVPDELLDKAFTTYARHKDAGAPPAWAVRHALASVMTDLALAADIAGLAATLRAAVADLDREIERRAEAILAPERDRLHTAIRDHQERAANQKASIVELQEAVRILGRDWRPIGAPAVAGISADRMRQALEWIGPRCTRYTRGSCIANGDLPVSRYTYTADQWCDGCRAGWALGVNPDPSNHPEDSTDD